MKSRDSLVRLKRFQVDEKRRRVAQIESMAADFLRIAADLDREIVNEEQKAGIADPLHFAYPTYARAARARRENLVRSAAELKEQLSDARAQLEEADAELTKAQGEGRRPRRLSGAGRDDGRHDGDARRRRVRVPGSEI